MNVCVPEDVSPLLHAAHGRDERRLSPNTSYIVLFLCINAEPTLVQLPFAVSPNEQPSDTKEYSCACLDLGKNPSLGVVAKRSRSLKGISKQLEVVGIHLSHTLSCEIALVGRAIVRLSLS